MIEQLNGTYIVLVDQEDGCWAEYWVMINNQDAFVNFSVQVSTNGEVDTASRFFFFCENPDEADSQSVADAMSECLVHFSEFIKYDS